MYYTGKYNYRKEFLYINAPINSALSNISRTFAKFYFYIVYARTSLISHQ